MPPDTIATENLNYFDSLFPLTNFVMVGYFAITFAPRWRHTEKLSLAVVGFYSACYALLLLHRVALVFVGSPFPDGAGFTTLAGVSQLFTDREAVLAGWVHFIAFDLFLSRHIVMDAHDNGIPHLAVVWIIPIVLNAGPVGFLFYTATKHAWLHFDGPQEITLSWVARQGLVVLYLLSSGLALFMVLWILVFPCSWLVGFSPSRDATYVENYAASALLPLSIVMKYDGHRLVQFTHILPAAVWAGAIPLQLHPSMRSNYPRLHRLSGYAFFFCGALMVGGLAVIDSRKLAFYHHDFPNLAPHEAASEFPWFDPAKNPLFPSHEQLLRAVGFWFAATGACALYLATKRRFTAHRSFVVRHIAAGLWVALQRALIPVLGLARGFATAPCGTGVAGSKALADCVSRRQKALFGDTAVLGIIIAVVVAEVAVWALGVPQGKDASKNKREEHHVKRP